MAETSGEGYTIEQVIANLITRYAPDKNERALKRLYQIHGDTLSYGFREAPDVVERSIMRHQWVNPDQAALPL